MIISLYFLCLLRDRIEHGVVDLAPCVRARTLDVNAHGDLVRSVVFDPRNGGGVPLVVDRHLQGDGRYDLAADLNVGVNVGLAAVTAHN